MKRKFFVFLFLFLFVVPGSANAHLAGQPPFFKINGTLSAQYNVPSTSLDDFALPQDIGIDLYLINVPIKFEILSDVLGVPQEIASKTTFAWDFGDGTKGEGLTNTHIYTKPGSYTVSVDAVYENEPVLIETSLLQVLPNAEFKLPRARIYINGKTTQDPLVDILFLPFGQSLSFDGSKSEAGSAKIASYQWDFGDQEQSSIQTVEHTYTQDSEMVFPVLRVTDENGFISDTFVQINRGEDLALNKKQVSSGNLMPLIIGVAGAGLLIAIVVLFLKKKRS